MGRRGRRTIGVSPPPAVRLRDARSSNHLPEGIFAYSIERAALIAEQLERLASLNVHQLAGQFANLDFWITEAAGALSALDGYSARFRALRDAQVAWVEAHGTKVYGPCPVCGGVCEFDPMTPPPPRRIPSEDIDAGRTRVRHAARRYLLRLYRARFLSEDAVRRLCDQLGANVETEDFERAAAPTRDSAEPQH